MKSVLISIQPKWCELIASGKKTVEVRKTRPKLETPFKVYIYCTQNNDGKIGHWLNLYCDSKLVTTDIHLEDPCYNLNGKVIGEFVCDAIFQISITYSDPESRIALKEFPFTCLTDKQIMDYFGNGKEGYGWHISDLVIYDKPKELSEFITPTACESTIAKHMMCNTCCLCAEFCSKKPKRITRPFQSWGYVEG